jgi:hypothetical protein
MAYSTSNPPALVWQAIANQAIADSAGTTQGSSGHGVKQWIYVSTDVSTVVDADGFFTNGFNLGMRRGDLVLVVERVSGGATTLVTMHTVARSTATGGCDLSDGTAMTTVTDSD